MASDCRYVVAHFFKSFNIPKRELLSVSNPNTLYALASTSFCTSSRPSIKERNFSNDISLKASFASPLVVPQSFIAIHVPKNAKEIVRSYFLCSSLESICHDPYRHTRSI